MTKMFLDGAFIILLHFGSLKVTVKDAKMPKSFLAISPPQVV